MAQTGMRDIRRRIKSIKSTMQITKGMELVASAKLTKARKALETVKPYREAAEYIFNNVTTFELSLKHPLFTGRDVKRELFIVITSDRGLCGGYNINIIREVTSGIPEGRDAGFIVIGSRGANYLKARGYRIVHEYPGISEAPRMEHAKGIADKVLGLFAGGVADRISLAYNKFVSALSQQPTIKALLPVTGNYESHRAVPEDILGFEPSYREAVDTLIPLYMSGVIYGALVEAAASEQAARRLAMEAATKNAKNMIEDLTLAYNRARQELITREITEITGGAEAVR